MEVCSPSFHPSLLTPWCRAASWFAASQEIPRISRNPKVHYRTHKRPPPVSILGQPNPVHIPTSLLPQIHSNIIHPSTPRSPQWSLSLRFPHQDPIHPPLLTHTRHMPTFCPHSVFMSYVLTSEQTAIISLYGIQRLGFITETQSVYCAVRSGSSYKTDSLGSLRVNIFRPHTMSW